MLGKRINVDINDRGLDCYVDGIKDRVVLRPYNQDERFYMNREAVFYTTSNITSGSIIQIPLLNQTFLAKVVENDLVNGGILCKYVELSLCNCTVTVKRMVKDYDNTTGRLIGTEETNVCENIPGSIYSTVRKADIEEPSIVNETDYKLIVKDGNGILVGDKVVIENNKYTIMLIDEFTYQGVDVINIKKDIT